MSIESLQSALSNFLANEDANKLAPILAEVLKSGIITYEKAVERYREILSEMWGKT